MLKNMRNKENHSSRLPSINKENFSKLNVGKMLSDSFKKGVQDSGLIISNVHRRYGSMLTSLNKNNYLR